MKVLELFAGIGACSKALDRLGIEHTIVDAVEIDKYAIKSFNAIHNTNFEPQDITKWEKDVEVDLIIHGSPCQDFSVAGKQTGGDKGTGTRSSLMYETIRIVEKLKPKYVIWENVKNVISKKHRHNFDNYLQEMESLGYTNYWQVLNAKDYGIPQNRERVFTVSILGNESYVFLRENINDNKIIEHNPKGKHQQDFVQDEEGLCRCIPAGTHGSTPHLLKTVVRNYNFPPKQELKLKLKDMLENEVNEKYFLTDKMLNCFLSDGTGNYPRRERFLGNMNRKNSDVGNSVTTKAGTRATDNYIKVKNATKQGYLEATDGVSVNLAYPVGVIESYVNKKYNEFKKENGYFPELFNPYNKKEIKDTAPTQSTQCGSTTSSATVLLKDNSRIRKLTPKECWRLMGFDDQDFEKASKVNSNTQLYKQAGNSIVVNVLVEILKKLL